MARSLCSLLEPLEPALQPKWHGRICKAGGHQITISGLAGLARLGDRVSVARLDAEPLFAEVTGFDGPSLVAHSFGPTIGVSAGDKAFLLPGSSTVRPSEDWLGAVLDWRGWRIDGAAPSRGSRSFDLHAPPPLAALRKPLGARMTTGHAVFDAFLPLCRGQRIGLFAGSGVGKSMLLASLARRVEADVCVIALVGERGREVCAFVENALGEQGMARTVVIATTSDQPALAKRQGARLAMTVAEYFRANGRHVLLIFDSLTRFAEAHREIALAGGEPPSLHAYPPSTFQAIASFVERAGPGVEGEGDITAIFSVLVAGSDMDEPVADMARGILDGHVVLDRAIAERGRFPAVNVRRSVSRSLPQAASDDQNALLREARALIAAYEESALIIQAGLYSPGADAQVDRAVRIWPALDAFCAEVGDVGPDARFQKLEAILAELG